MGVRPDPFGCDRCESTLAALVPYSAAVVGYSLPGPAPIDPDVPTYQGWFYIMGGTNQGPFWQWSPYAKQSTIQSANAHGQTAVLWRWEAPTRRWLRALWYNPGGDGPYLDNV